MSGAEETLYREVRPLVFAIAYRMLGSAAEAEDVVQEAFLRLQRASEHEGMRSPKAFLATADLKLCVQRFKR